MPRSTKHSPTARRSMEAPSTPIACVTPTRVLLVQVRRRSVSAHWTGLTRKRRTIWHNDARNETVAAVASAVQRGDPKSLQALGIADLLRDRAETKVKILVESTEHGNALLEMLLGWDMLHIVPDDTPVNYDLEPRAPFRWPMGWVATLMHARLYHTSADVLVRATGGCGKLEMRGFPSEMDVTGGPSLVIDFDDDFDERARQDTEARVRDYRERGWQFVETDTTTI